MALTAEQQAEFNKVKETVDTVLNMYQDSLNLQANGGYAVRNIMIDLKAQLAKVEEA